MMKQFIKDIWYGEPVRLFGALAAAGTAVVAFTDLPTWADIAIVAAEGLAGFYGTRQLTTPEYVERISKEGGGELEEIIGEFGE